MIQRTGGLLPALFLLGPAVPATADNAGLLAPSLALPKVGDNALNIVSSDILELIRVNTKPTGTTTTPDSWNFVSGGVFTAPALSEFAVTVDGSPVAVTDVFFKRRPRYAPLKARDLRIDNRLYLRLAGAVPDGATVTVTNPSNALWPAAMTFTRTADWRRETETVHVNQEGYTSADPKVAMVGHYTGSGGELLVTPGTSFLLVDACTGVTVFTGTLTMRPDIGWTMTPLPYQSVLQADFSAFTTQGEYQLVVPGYGASVPFLIHPSLAMGFARAYALGLYNQRSGTAVALPWSRHTHGASHTAPASIPYPQSSFTVSWQNITSANSGYSTNARHTAPRLADEASQLYPFVRTGVKDVSGGHHDAGDYSKYTINSAQLIHALTFAADSMAGAGALDNLGIPESGDGKSDLLQEAKQEADFLAKMQDDDGGFYFLVYPKDRKYEDNVLPDAGDPQVVWPKTTAATAAAVGALAELGSSPLFKATYPAAAADYLAKAQAGWQFLLGAIATKGKDGSYQMLTHYGDVFMHDDELAWAACSIFLATGDSTAHAKLLEWYDPSSRDTRRWSWWRLFESYGCAARGYAFAVSSGRRLESELDATYYAKCRAEVVAGGDVAMTRTQKNAYGTAFDEESKRSRAAGWYFSMDRAFDIVAALQITNKPGYLEAICSNLNYEAGTNPVNVSYITGLGQRMQREIVHQYAQNDRRVLPPVGIPLGNIQKGFVWLAPYTTELGPLTFPSDGAENAPFPMYDRWADTFNTNTEFVAVNQARSLAALAWLAARTPAATQAWNSAAATITLPSPTLVSGVPVTVTLSVPGLDLTDARIVWEALGQEPVFSHASHTFTPTTAGMQWIEAEAWLPDGRRVAAQTTFFTSSPDGGAPFAADADTVALYHFDSNYSDATANNLHLTAAGNTTRTTDNTGWMAIPSGSLVRFSGIGDTLTVTIPDSLVLPGSAAAPLSVEAWFYPRAWKAYSVGNYPVISLNQWWDSLLEVKDGMWSNPRCPSVSGAGAVIVPGAAWNSAVTLHHWHQLRITLYANKTVKCFIDGTLVGSATASSFNAGRTTVWTLTLGNFDGDLDEVRLSRALRD